MLETIKGVYENGQIQIDRQPQHVGDRSQVLVTFINSTNIDPAKLSEFIDSLFAQRSAGIERLTPINRND
jgi:hypothetical protein